MRFEDLVISLQRDSVIRRANCEQDLFGLNDGIFFDETYPVMECGFPTMCDLSEEQIAELRPRDAIIDMAYFNINPSGVAGKRESLVIKLDPYVAGTQRIYHPGKKLRFMEDFGVLSEEACGGFVKPVYDLEALKGQEITAYFLNAGIAGISKRLRLD